MDNSSVDDFFKSRNSRIVGKIIAILREQNPDWQNDEFGILDGIFSWKNTTVLFPSLLFICDFDTNATLVLSKALVWTMSRFPKEPEGWFYHSRAQWRQELGLTRHKLARARNILRDKGFLEEDTEAVTPKIAGRKLVVNRVIRYRANFAAISQALYEMNAYEIERLQQQRWSNLSQDTADENWSDQPEEELPDENWSDRPEEDSDDG